MISAWAANTVFGKYQKTQPKPVSYKKWKEDCVGSAEWYAAQSRGPVAFPPTPSEASK